MVWKLKCKKKNACSGSSLKTRKPKTANRIGTVRTRFSFISSFTEVSQKSFAFKLATLPTLEEVWHKSFAFKLAAFKLGESLAEQLPFQLSSIEKTDKTER